MPKTLKLHETRSKKPNVAIKVLRRARRSITRFVVVAGSTYGSSEGFVNDLCESGISFVVEIRPSDHVECVNGNGIFRTKSVRASNLLRKASWKDTELLAPYNSSSTTYSVAELGRIRLQCGKIVRLFVAQRGCIKGLHPGTTICVTSIHNASLQNLLHCVGWARWIRPFVRRQERTSLKTPNLSNGDSSGGRQGALTLRHRSNITLARVHDESFEIEDAARFGEGPSGKAFAASRVLNVAELFAGAGGMGLGFLTARTKRRRFRIIISGELHPVYAQTLRSNHEYIMNGHLSSQAEIVPGAVQAVDLNSRRAFELVASRVCEAGALDVLVGGPPCQGFSSANRNSWSSDNPHNRMVNVFIRYVEKLMPRVFLMENVQGIVWTARNGNGTVQTSVASHVFQRMKAAGYLVFPKLLDAVWYGVPQFRTRFFVLGIHRDSGYHTDDFGEWGPFPTPTHGSGAMLPFVTVREAISDLPSIGNNQLVDRIEYSQPRGRTLAHNPFLALMRDGAPRGAILDHVTSKHAKYVIERYRRIRPGGNWQDIVELMSNYSDVNRTHSNIYRRLEWDQPSITIGHYRKSMLVHPAQHRGLSLREACRLQTFPDWFRFAGTHDGAPGGLVHKQQQLANAVCPLLSKAIAEFILKL